jgi:hypothetical protein
MLSDPRTAEGGEKMVPAGRPGDAEYLCAIGETAWVAIRGPRSTSASYAQGRDCDAHLDVSLLESGPFTLR